MSSALREGARQLENTARVCLLVLALASGVYTYIGVRGLLDGSAPAVFAAAVIYAGAVSVGIYAFWAFMLRLLPHTVDRGGRALLFGAMALGCMMIVAMSSWLNASALAGSAAVEQHLSTTLGRYERDLERAHANGLAAQGLSPDIELAASRFSQLADAERSGSLTGTTGSGTVVQLLTQMASQLRGLSGQVAASGERVATLHGSAAKHLSAMREFISGSGPVAQRADAFGTEATAFSRILSELQQASIAPAVKRAATDFVSSFIAPAADGRTPDLMGRQNEVVSRVQAAVTTQAKALAQAADAVIAMPRVEPTRFEQISPADAVLRYWSDFIPSWAGAMSIDLLPLVLVLSLCVVHAALRREGDPAIAAERMSTAELLAALRFAREVEEANAALRAVPAAARPAPDEALVSDAVSGEAEPADKVTAFHARPPKRTDAP